jgi:hypothetical protein
MPRICGEGADDPRTAAEGSRLRSRTEGLRTRPIGSAGVVGASDMATGVVVGSAVILAPVVAAAWPANWKEAGGVTPGSSAIAVPVVT